MAFFDDANPDKKIWRTLNFPLTVSKSVVLSEIRKVGSEIQKSTTLNAERVVGQIVSIPGIVEA